MHKRLHPDRSGAAVVSSSELVGLFSATQGSPVEVIRLFCAYLWSMLLSENDNMALPSSSIIPAQHAPDTSYHSTGFELSPRGHATPVHRTRTRAHDTRHSKCWKPGVRAAGDKARAVRGGDAKNGAFTPRNTTIISLQQVRQPLDACICTASPAARRPLYRRTASSTLNTATGRQGRLLVFHFATSSVTDPPDLSTPTLTRRQQQVPLEAIWQIPGRLIRLSRRGRLPGRT